MGIRYLVYQVEISNELVFLAILGIEGAAITKTSWFVVLV